jgi:hypothetical protein
LGQAVGMTGREDDGVDRVVTQRLVLVDGPEFQSAITARAGKVKLKVLEAEALGS